MSSMGELESKIARCRSKGSSRHLESTTTTKAAPSAATTKTTSTSATDHQNRYRHLEATRNTNPPPSPPLPTRAPALPAAASSRKRAPPTSPPAPPLPPLPKRRQHYVSTKTARIKTTRREMLASSPAADANSMVPRTHFHNRRIQEPSCFA